MAGEEVYTTRVDGSARYYLNGLGHVDSLNYGDTMAGGNDAATMNLEYDPTHRHEAFQVGRRICVQKGGSVQWEGTLAEPTPNVGSGWGLTAVGSGNWGTSYRAIYTLPWGAGTTTDIINQAIARGLRWVRGTVSGGDMSQAQDSASQTVTDHLNQVTSVQSTTWRVHRVQAGLQVDLVPIPSAVTRLLVTTVPAARTIAGYVNALYTRYTATVDASGTAATFGLASSVNTASVAAHDRLEEYWDLSSAGLLSSGAATADSANAIAKYQAASYTGAFTVAHGQYLTVGGAPVDLGTEHAGEVAQLLFADGSYGGQLTPGPVIFPVGQVQYDADSDQLAVTAFQTWNNSLSNLLTLLAPKAPA
jgi:hypothetical protein